MGQGFVYGLRRYGHLAGFFVVRFLRFRVLAVTSYHGFWYSQKFWTFNQSIYQASGGFSRAFSVSPFAPPILSIILILCERTSTIIPSLFYVGSVYITMPIP